MKLATSTGDFIRYEVSQLDALTYIKEAGFSYADYNFHMDYVRKNGVYSRDFESHFVKIADHAQETGIKLVQAHAPMGDPISEDISDFVKDTILCVDACGAWGIPNLVVHSGYLAGLSKEETFEENKKFFEPVLEHAEKYGINILTENFNKMCLPDTYWIDNATDLLELIEYIDHPLFHAVWDVGHANLQEMSQDEELRIVGKHVKALHIQDNKGILDDHLMPFLGTMNMDAIIHGLFDIGYNGYFTFEVGGIFTPPTERRPFSTDTRLLAEPLALKRAMERCLFELGKTVLEAYNCFEK